MTRIKSDFLLLLCMLSPLICYGYVVISSDSSYTPRPIHCRAGQAYWCKNISTAVECRTLQHCIKGVWEKQVPSEKDSSSVCQTCIDKVKQAKDQLESNETQAEIREVLEASCKVIPIKALRMDCDKLMDDFGSYLVDTLASQMNPQVVCSVAGLCNNPAFKKAKNHELTCESCFGLMRQVEDEIHTATDDDFRTALLRVCRNFGSYSDRCSAYVVTHLPQIALLLSNHVKAAPVCSLAGVCTENFHSHAALIRFLWVGLVGAEDKDVEVKVRPEENDDLPCELCELLVEFLRYELIGNLTESEFKLGFMHYCQAELTGEEKKECIEIAQNYSDAIYEFIDHEGNVLCSQIGICPQEIDAKNHELTCESCFGLMRLVEDKINKATDDDFRTALLRVCRNFGSYSDGCSAYVETHLPKIALLLSNHVKAAPVCSLAGVCTEKFHSYPALIRVGLVGAEDKDVKVKAGPEENDDLPCELCKHLVEFLRDELIGNLTESEFKDALMQYCQEMTGEDKKKCIEEVEIYSDEYYELIDHEGKVLCSQIGICPQGIDAKNHELTCESCFGLMRLVEDKIDKATDDDFRSALLRVCRNFGSYSDGCSAYVETHLPKIALLLSNHVKAAPVCSLAGVCTEKFHSHATLIRVGLVGAEDKDVKVKAGPEENDDLPCELCKHLVEFLRDELIGNLTESEFKDALMQYCQEMTGEDKKKCIEEVEIYSDEYYELIDHEGKVLCSQIGICPQGIDAKNHKLTCESCFGLMRQVEDKIDKATDDDFRNALLRVCRNFGSYSDGCSAYVVTHLPQISLLLSNHVKAAPVCSLAGVCTEKFHSNATLLRVGLVGAEDKDVEVKAGYEENDDFPSELCELLVEFLRDELIGNLTESEFKLGLTVLCEVALTGEYQEICVGIVEMYSDDIYEFLDNELEEKVLCSQIGICPQGIDADLRPLLPVRPPALESVQPLPVYQRPAMVLDPLINISKAMRGSPKPQNQMLCSFCEYFLLFVQQEITLPSSEKKIRDVVEKACTRLPASVSDQCTSFNETYADTFIALLAIRTDPSHVCPDIGVCPGSLILVEYKDKPTCSLCLLAMEKVLRKVPNKTQEDINDALDDLCIRDVFPNSLTTECATFINTYREPLTDMIVADFTSEEACLYANICSLPQPKVQKEEKSSGSVATNEIVVEHKNTEGDSKTCVSCELVVTKVKKFLKNKTTEEEIKKTVYEICKYMPHTVTAQCKKFIKSYADILIELTNKVSPKEICQVISDKASSLLQRRGLQPATCLE